ncbi:MAG TPA: C-terminal helicase domain-containing protein, partial [Microvirga sp.]|nr:C-terminal helicase domain-containing protein [Microvirga sp.]
QRLIATGREPHEKRETLRTLIRRAEDLNNAIVFCNRKRDVAVLHRSLQTHGFNAAALHGDMDQRARMAALEGFRNGDTTVLVASDVAARGLDIPAVSHVFNYDVPHHAEDYVHRIGRTGRAGRSGAAYTLVAPGDERSLQAIEKLIQTPVEWEGITLAERPPSEGPSRRRERGDDRPRARVRKSGRGEARSEARGEARAAPRERARREAAPERDEAPPARAARPARETPRRERQEQRPRQDRERPREERPRNERVREESPREDRVREERPREERPREERPREARVREERPRDERPRPERAERHGRESEASVVGFGDHIPAFLLPAGGKGAK